MRGTFRFLNALVWLTQLGLSAAGPPVVFILLGSWLHKSLGWGSWTVTVGVILGVLGAIGGLISSFQALHRLAKKEQAPPAGYNEHE